MLMSICVIACYTSSRSQSIFLPGGTTGISATGVGVTGVGIFTATPIINGYFDVQGDARLNGGTTGDGVWFASPASEKGFSIMRSPLNNRADVRFDDNYLRMLVGPAVSGPPDPTKGICISNTGSIGMGLASPGNNDRLAIVGSGVNSTGVSSTMTMVNASATRGFFTDVQNSFVSNIGIEANSSGTADNYGGIFTAQDRNTNGDNFGVKATATGGYKTYGGNFAASNGSGLNYGVYSEATGGSLATAGEFYAQAASSQNIGVKVESDGGSTLSMAGHFEAKNSDVVWGVIGKGSGNGAPGSNALGGSFSAYNAEDNKGLWASATGAAGNNLNTGIYVTATQSDGYKNAGIIVSAQSTHLSGSKNVGVEAYANAAGGGCDNYGVHATIEGGFPAPPTPGLPGTAGSYAGYFMDRTTATSYPYNNANGAAYFNGNVVFGAGVTSISDKKFKENIEGIDNALEMINKLSPATYTFKGRDAFPSFTFSAGKQYGFIAQELEKVIPELVEEKVNPAQYDKEGKKIADAVPFKGIEYTELIPILTAGIQEQQSIISKQQVIIDDLQADIVEQKNKIDELEERLKAMEMNLAGINGNENTSVAVLYQNTPNPTSGNTEIRYKLPLQSVSANITIYDMNGRQIRTIELSGSGEGYVNVSTSELESGIYLYSLIINGQEADTKRMVISK